MSVTPAATAAVFILPPWVIEALRVFCRGQSAGFAAKQSGYRRLQQVGAAYLCVSQKNNSANTIRTLTTKGCASTLAERRGAARRAEYGRQLLTGASRNLRAFQREDPDEECEDARPRGGAVGFRRAGSQRFGDVGGGGRQEDRGLLENLSGRALEDRRRRHQEDRRGCGRHLYLHRRARLRRQAGDRHRGP